MQMYIQVAKNDNLLKQNDKSQFFVARIILKVMKITAFNQDIYLICSQTKN